MNKKIKDIVITSICVVLLAVSAWIKIPLIIPISLQNLVLFIILGVFGFKISIITIIVYILSGLIGIPVFSSGVSSLSGLLGITGGYLISFIIYPFIFYLLQNLHFKNNNIKLFIIFLILTVITYLIGSLWYYVLYINNNEFVLFTEVLSLTIVPYILPDIIKILISILVINRIKKIKNE